MWCHFVQSAQGDFKNIFMILQNKSLITGNYGFPVLDQSLLTPPLPPPPSSSFLLSALSSPHSVQKANRVWRREAITWTWCIRHHGHRCSSSIHLEWLTFPQQLPAVRSKLDHQGELRVLRQTVACMWMDWPTVLGHWVHWQSDSQRKLVNWLTDSMW